MSGLPLASLESSVQLHPLESLEEALKELHPKIEWDSDTWVSHEELPSRKSSARIVWPFSHMANLTKEQARALWRFIEAGKVLFAKILVEPPADYGPYDFTSATQLQRRWKVLIGWLLDNHFYRLSQVKVEDTLDFMKHIANSPGRASSEKRRTQESINAYHLLLRLVRDCTADLDDKLYSVVDRKKVKRLGSRDRQKSWVTRDQAIAIIAHAIDVVENLGPQIIELRRDRVRDGPIRTHDWRDPERMAFNEAHPLSSELSSVVSFYGFSQNASGAQRFLAGYLRTAAKCSVLFLAGPRSGEVTNLKRGCLTLVDTTHGKELAVSGVFSKTKKPAVWIAAEPVVTAIRTMESVAVAEGQSSKRGYLWAVGNVHLDERKSNVTRSLLSKEMRQFARLAIHRYAPGSSTPSKLIPTDGRSYFARFTSLRCKDGLGHLAVHYGHVSDRLTEDVYAGASADLREELDDASLEDLEECVLDLLTATSHFGEGIQSNPTPHESRLTDIAQVDVLIRSGVVLAPCDWGYCLYRQETSKCQGGPAGPNKERRTPSVCSGCVNFNATARHAGWWALRRETHAEFLKSSGAHQQARKIVKIRIAECDAVLTKIGEPAGTVRR
jgi:hypothetical protein